MFHNTQDSNPTGVPPQAKRAPTPAPMPILGWDSSHNTYLGLPKVWNQRSPTPHPPGPQTRAGDIPAPGTPWNPPEPSLNIAHRCWDWEKNRKQMETNPSGKEALQGQKMRAAHPVCGAKQCCLVAAASLLALICVVAGEVQSSVTGVAEVMCEAGLPDLAFAEWDPGPRTVSTPECGLGPAQRQGDVLEARVRLARSPALLTPPSCAGGQLCPPNIRAASPPASHARKFSGALQQPELRGLGQLHGGRLPAGGLRHDPERLRLEHCAHLHADAGETLLLRLPVPAGHGLQLGDVRQRGRQRLRGRHRQGGAARSNAAPSLV